MKVNYLLLLFILIFSANSMDIFGQTNWHKYIGNPVLLPGDEGQWDYQFINVRSVLWDGEKYNMWYQGGDGDNRCFGHATSNDGFNWLKNESNPIMSKGALGSWDGGSIRNASILYDGDKYVMWYVGFCSTLKNSIGFATSNDGINWGRDTANNPVIFRGEQSSDFDFDGCFSPYVIHDDSVYKMWYAGSCYNFSLNAFIFKIGYAESEDGISWTKHNGPVLSEGDDLTWANDLQDPMVIKFDNKYHMWYSSINTKRNQDRVINYAISEDGISWNKYEKNPVLINGVVPDWDHGNIWRPWVNKEDKLYKMWYSGYYFGWRSTGENDLSSIGYAEDFSNFVHAKSVVIDDLYFKPGDVPINIIGHIINPEGHSVVAKAYIKGDKEIYLDSIDIFDDGLNGDGEANDGIFGAEWLPASEDNFTVGIKTVDQETGFTRNGLNWSITDRFTTKGPIVLEKFEITSPDTILNPGERFKFALTLKNEGVTDTVHDVFVNIISEDTTIIESTTGVPEFGDIAPGESMTNSSRDFAITLKNGLDSASVGEHELKFEFTSNGEVFWEDNYTLFVETLVDVKANSKLPTDYSLSQNYPNPFNPNTKINYSIPKQSNVTLKIYDILGSEVATLVNKEHRQGNYEVEFSAKGGSGSDGDGSGLTSGIYFYRLQVYPAVGGDYPAESGAGEYVETKKMILMK